MTGRVPRVGYLPSASAAASDGAGDRTFEALQRALADLGHVSGRTIAFEPRRAEGRLERLPELAAELLREGVDLIVTLGGVATRAAKQATAAVPIVFAVVIDPVKGGLVADWARPGENLTGFTSFDPEQMRPHLERLKEAVPGVARVAFLGDGDVPGSPEASRAWDKAQAAAVGLEARTFRVRGPRPDFEGVFEAARRDRVDALLVLEMPATVAHRRRIGALALRYALPALFVGSYDDTTGLLAYGTSRAELAQRVAGYVDTILRGVGAGTLPVERLRRYELIVDARTAGALGITLPPVLLRRADRVIA
jgi:putative ABC transport system substrate-binding protein